MISGAQKAGTSSLHRLLAQHPDLMTHSAREFPYFIDEDLRQAGFDAAFSRFFGEEMLGRQTLAKSVGVMYFPDAIRELAKHSPGCRVIAYLREPAARAYSAYWYCRRRGWETAQTFEQAIEEEREGKRTEGLLARHCRHLQRGAYTAQIECLYEAFGEGQVHIGLFEEFVRDAVGEVHSLADALGLPAFDFQPMQPENKGGLPRNKLLTYLLGSSGPLKRGLRNLVPSGLRDGVRYRLADLNRKKGSPPAISPETRVQLIDYYAPEVQQLEGLLGRSLDPWHK